MAKSLQQFREWAVVTGGNISNPTNVAASKHAGQCVSLIQQYLNQLFGVPYAARGHAKDFTPPGFKAVTGALKPGDIIRYNKNFGGGYGHIEMIDDTGRALGQNRNWDKRVTRGGVMSGYTTIFRPTKAFNVKTPAPANPGTGGRVAQTGTFTPNRNMNIRRSPSISGQVAATLPKGWSVKYDSYIDREGIRWISYIGNSGNRNYVARRTLDNKVIYGTAK